MHNFQVPRFVAGWVKNSLANQENILATSNQGTILLYQKAGMEFVVKTAMGKGAVRKARQATLEREYLAYQRLEGLPGVPRCYGMVAERYLVLEYVHGKPYREAIIEERGHWFDQLLGIIRGFHDRGVSHGDLKSKSNLMVTDRGEPCVIDFGTTFMYKQGFHLINNKMFEYGKRLDLNAWVKHKYHGRYEDASDADQALLNYSLLERLARKWNTRNY